jgi:RNA polymerase sporulation-specific sigma factor
MKRQVITAVKAATRNKHQPLNEYVSFSRPLTSSDGESATIGDLIPDKGRSPEDIVIGQETFHGLLDILTGELSYLEYSVLKLYLEGEPYETIAEELAEDPKVVDNALQRVKRKAQEYLGIQK